VPRPNDDSAASESGASATSGIGENPSSAKPTTEQLLERILKTLDTHTERFGKLEGAQTILTKDVIRLRKGQGAAEVAEESGSADGKSSTRATQGASGGGTDALAQLDLAELLAELRPEARAKVRERLEGGATVTNVVAELRFAREVMGAAESAVPSKAERATPPGRAANASPEPAGQTFRSWADWQKFRKDKGLTAAQNYLDRHASFDPTELQGSPGRRGRGEMVNPADEGGASF